jgi:GNAT superfamily N-acetyltransferase
MTVTSPLRPPTKPRVILEPMDLDKREEFDELLKQRVLCGWNKTPAYVEGCRDSMAKGYKSLFWICLPPAPDPESTAPNGGESKTYDGKGHRRIGHIGFQSVPDVGEPDSDLELASTDKSVVMISTFFILKEHRGGGIGRAAMEALEAMTQVVPYGSPACRSLTLHTLCRRYIEDDGDGSPEAWRTSRGIWERLGENPRDRGTSNEDWYVRMGYVKWKEEPRYIEQTLDGAEIKLLASFLRKML